MRGCIARSTIASSSASISGRQRARRLLLAAIDGVDQLRQRAAVERQRAGEHLVEHDAGGVDVALRAGVLRLADLLGRHVVRRAEEEAGLREDGLAAAGAAFLDLGDAEVGDLHRRRRSRGSGWPA